MNWKSISAYEPPENIEILGYFKDEDDSEYFWMEVCCFEGGELLDARGNLLCDGILKCWMPLPDPPIQITHDPASSPNVPM